MTMLRLIAGALVVALVAPWTVHAELPGTDDALGTLSDEDPVLEAEQAPAAVTEPDVAVDPAASTPDLATDDLAGAVDGLADLPDLSDADRLLGLVGPVMQASPQHPVWTLLSTVPAPPGRWAQMMVDDMDGNGRTEFLDIAAAMGTVDPLLRAELLVYGSPRALASIQADAPHAVRIDAIDAVFVTWRLNDLAALERPGVELMVWEPRAVATSSDPADGDPAGLPHNELHDLDDAWEAGYTGSGMRIAVLDTGANPLHDSLQGKVTFKDCVNDLAIAYDDNGHGTHVASIAAGNDGHQYRGAAYHADILAVKVSAADGSGTLADFHCGISHVINRGGQPRADVATMSAGLKVPGLGITTLNGGPLDIFGWDRAAARLPGAGIPFTISAGNHPGTVLEVYGADESLRVGVNGVDQVASPAFADEVIAVGAMDIRRAMAHFSALGPGKTASSVKPDVVAVGTNVWGALHDDVDGYVQWDGTSMATPVVAGALALMAEKEPGRSPEEYARALRDQATSTCIVTTSQSQCSVQGINTEQRVRPSTVDGYGYIHAKASLDVL